MDIAKEYRKIIRAMIDSPSTREYLMGKKLENRFLKTVLDKDGNIQVVKKWSHTKRLKEEASDDTSTS